MKFSDKREDFYRMVEFVCLLVCLGAVFFQIWLLLSIIETSSQQHHQLLLPSVVLSGLAFLGCGLSVLLTSVDFLKGLTEGRSNTYQKKF